MSKYVDGFVLVVPKAGLEAYKKISHDAGKVWMEYGALEYRETVGEDLNIEFGLPFRELTKAAPEEEIVFSWIVYNSREHRDEVNAKVMADERMKEEKMKEMPFDVKKMSWGGFETIVDFQK